MVKKLVLVMTIGLVFFGCSAVALKPGAEKIRLTNQEPQKCKFLGEVSGSQGNVISGVYTSNDNLELGARNELKNKALEMGGNVVQILTSEGAHTVGQGGGGKTSHNLLGNAYNCPESK